ncbi:MAG TPA: S8 family serine peptidase, partial [Pyrinomonadaceae bacterium]|nr:S8 family serine peptidase [Pyrinomonadaceae bacterium]
LPMRAHDGREIPVEVESFEGSKLVDGLRLARVPAEDTLRAIEALNARPDVEFAEPDYIWRKTQLPNDPRFGELYGLRNTGQDFGNPDDDIDADEAWDVTTGSSNTVVAVIDGGVDINHEDLRDNIWTNPGEVANNGLDDDGNGFIDDVNGWDFHHNDKSVFDNENGDDHGTHVAGTIGATGNNGTGVTGVNWHVRIMSLKVLGPSGGSTSNIISGYNYVRMMRQQEGINVRVTNNSYGGGGFSQSAFVAIQELNNAGILFVASAGNEASDNFKRAHFPSDFKLPNIISVASTNRTDDLSSFSNFGERIVPMAAPGSQILSTTPNNTYSIFSGTSMATPHVTGAAALVLSVNPNISLQNLRGVLVYSGDMETVLLDKTTSGRRLNARAAVNSATENGGVADTTAPENPRNLQVTLVNGRQVTLQWTAPGDDGASGTITDYDFTFLQFGGGRLILPVILLPAQPGITQTATVTVPYLNQNGTIELRAYDNAGNFGASTVSFFIGQNEQTDPYITALNTGPEVLSTGGTPIGLIGDDKYHENFLLPFGFSFYGQARGGVTISTNGALYFSPPLKRDNGDADDLPSSVPSLQGQIMIAGLWDDLRTDRRAGDDVFVIQDSSHVIFRWQAVTFGDGTPASERPVNFEIELRIDGTIIFRYGAGQAAPINTDLFSVVGISAGEPDPYIISSHTAGTIPLALTNANVVTFTRRQPPATSFQFSHSLYSMVEHDRTVGIMVTRTGDTSTLQVVNLRAQGDPPSLFGLGQVIFFPGDTFKIAVLETGNDEVVEANENFILRLEQFSAGTTLGAQSTATLNIIDDDTFPANSVAFTGAALQTVNENAGKIDLTVVRSPLPGGDLSQDAFVSYRTFPSTALETKDYSFAGGTLHFLPGETTKTITIFITNDIFDEPNEGFDVELSNPIRTKVLVLANTLVRVEIQDEDPAGLTANPSDNSTFFVTQHYVDFLNRLPDSGGLDFWRTEIEQCGTDAQCREIKRINVSAAFYLAIEFQESGFLVYRTYKTAFGNMPGAPPAP